MIWEIAIGFVIGKILYAILTGVLGAILERSRRNMTEKRLVELTRKHTPTVELIPRVSKGRKK